MCWHVSVCYFFNMSLPWYAHILRTKNCLSHLPSPAFLSQLCTLILQPLALGCTVLQQDLPPSFNGVQPVHLLILTSSISWNLLRLSLKLLHRWLWHLLANFPLPTKWGHPVEKKEGNGWWRRLQTVMPMSPISLEK